MSLDTRLLCVFPQCNNRQHRDGNVVSEYKLKVTHHTVSCSTAALDRFPPAAQLKLGRLPASIAVGIFDLLMAHLLSHYEQHSFSEVSSIVHLVVGLETQHQCACCTHIHTHTRTHTHTHTHMCTTVMMMCVFYCVQIFELILKIRANEGGHIGLVDGDRPVVYTPFIVCGPCPKGHRPVPPPVLPGALKPLSGQRWGAVEVLTLDYNQSYDALLFCLQRVRPWLLFGVEPCFKLL